MGRRSGLTAAAALALVTILGALAGCDAGSGSSAEEPSGSADSAGSSGAVTPGPAGGSPTAATTPTSTLATGVAAFDTEHAVAPPGPRSGPLVSADLLVVGQEGLSDAVVDRVRRTAGVTGVVRVSLATPSVEGRLVKVMAVDPGTYRNFTPLQSAENQAVWDRVAGGEIAVDTTLRRALEPDGDGFLTVGADADAPRIHVAAWAPQIAGAVDAVVNEKWGRALGMRQANALLVTTTMTAPDRVVKPLQAVLGGGVSVQRLDAVARLGLDPRAVQMPVLYGQVAQAVGNYTYAVAGGGRVVPSASWVSSHIVTETVPILGAVTCNKYLFPQLKGALAEVQSRNLASKIDPGQYAGCYYPRFIAGTHALSNHAFGLALDLNVPGNQRGTVGQMDRTIVAIFEKWGFTWGGRWHYTDPMHFEMNRIVHPR